MRMHIMNIAQVTCIFINKQFSNASEVQPSLACNNLIDLNKCQKNMCESEVDATPCSVCIIM